MSVPVTLQTCLRFPLVTWGMGCPSIIPGCVSHLAIHSPIFYRAQAYSVACFVAATQVRVGPTRGRRACSVRSTAPTRCTVLVSMEDGVNCVPP